MLWFTQNSIGFTIVYHASHGSRRAPAPKSMVDDEQQDAPSPKVDCSDPPGLLSRCRRANQWPICMEWFFFMGKVGKTCGYEVFFVFCMAKVWKLDNNLFEHRGRHWHFLWEKDEEN